MKIESSDIYRSIKFTLEKTFTGIKVQTKDRKNPNPPCFYIKYIDNTNTQTATEYENDSYAFAIEYFSKIEKLQDLLFVEKILKGIFKKPLKIILSDEGKNNIIQWVEIDSCAINLNEDDYILNCTINISLDQLIIKSSLGSTDFEDRYEIDGYENNENMEILEIEI